MTMTMKTTEAITTEMKIILKVTPAMTLALPADKPMTMAAVMEIQLLFIIILDSVIMAAGFNFPNPEHA